MLSCFAAFSLVMSMCPSAAALANAGDQLAAGLADAEVHVITAQADEFIEVAEQTHRMTTGTYRVTRDVAIKYDRRTNNGIQVEKGAKVLLIIDEGKTLTVIGSAGAIFDCGYAGILLPEGSTLTVAGKGTLNATGGDAGRGQAGCGAGLPLVGWSDDDSTSYTSNAGGGAKGGGGASANIDGECAIFGGADLDDLWGYGGFGGTSTWGGAAGARGFYGATGKGESTNASTKYAKSGGSGGTSAAPKAVAFYTYKSSSSDTPKATSTPGYGGAPVRNATPLNSLEAYMNLGGHAGVVSGGTYQYDGKQHGVSVNSSGALSTQSADVSALRAQAADGEGYDESGTTTVDGVEVEYSVAYYDEAGNRLDSAPVMSGQYAAAVTVKCDDPVHADYNGSWVEPIVIAKRQVAKPTPAELVFECADWSTGEGALQDAFPGLDEADYAFVAGATADDGTTSLKSAKEPGEYVACFKLKDPATCQWEGESEDVAECWVPWSVKLQEFDPKDVTYWGPAYNNNTTTVDYTGAPIWVRLWYTYTKDVGGKFPEWFTHWGSADRPTTDRLSSCVVYVQGADDHEGLVGYHTNADGSLEKVTAEQVYAWANGVDIDGQHVAVESGDKVWYKTGADGWKVPLAVQGERPEGAEGYVVARDYAYADRLGVKDVGTYQAYALFDEGAGFESTSIAEATVEVKASTKAAPAKASSPKTGDFPLGIVIGIVVVALIAAGAIAIAARRRSK